MNSGPMGGALMLAAGIGLIFAWRAGILDGLIAGATDLVRAGANVPKTTAAGSSVGGGRRS